MITGYIFQRPVTEPVVIFLIMLLIIFFAPRVLKYLRIPGIVGFIIAGLLIGPHGFGIIEKEGGIQLFSTFGLMYIMFLLGLELDMADFRKNREKSIVFGALTFIIPIVAGYFVSRYLIKLDFFASLLLASMFSTQTLISYPIVNKLGLTRHRNTNLVVGGTIITDTAVLLLLAVITKTMNGQQDIYFWLQISSSIALLLIIMLWLVPLISRWLFKKLAGNIEGEFLVLMLVLFLAGSMSKFAGVEPMIGAFLAGIALNRMVPFSSTLMKRTIFVGNTIFIPIFLISVGMIVDFRVFLQGYDALEIMVILIITALVTKYLAAWATQLIFGYKSVDRNYIFGLSASHAAATIALVVVGYNVGLFDIVILNGTIGVIFISCLVSSFFTENSGKKLAIQAYQDGDNNKNHMQRILVPVSNKITMPNLINFALLIKEPGSIEPIYPLSVILGDIDSETAKEQVQNIHDTVEQVIGDITFAGARFFPVTRVELNIANGINRAIKELLATQVVLGWNGKITTATFIFGSVVEGILTRNNQMIIVAKLQNNYTSYSRLLVMIPPNAEFEKGFESWLRMINNLAKQLSVKVLFLGLINSIEQCRKTAGKHRLNMIAEYHGLNEIIELEGIEKHFHRNDLSVFISARPRTLSYSSYVNHLPKNLSKQFAERDFVIVYPEQAGTTDKPSAETIDGIKDSPIRENIERISKISKKIGKTIRKKSE